MADGERTAPAQSLPTTDDLADALRAAIKVIETYLATPVAGQYDERVRVEFALKIIDFVMG